MSQELLRKKRAVTNTDSASIAQIVQALDTGLRLGYDWNTSVPLHNMHQMCFEIGPKLTVFRANRDFTRNRAVETPFVEALEDGVVNVMQADGEKVIEATKHSITVGKRKRREILDLVERCLKSGDAATWFEWTRDRAWQGHASGERGLFSEEHFQALADALRTSVKDIAKLHTVTKSQIEIRNWIQHPVGSTYEDVARCFIFSVILRGIANTRVAELHGAAINLHPIRILRSYEDTVGDIEVIPRFSALYCATLISIARQESGIEARLGKLATLIQLTRRTAVNTKLDALLGPAGSDEEIERRVVDFAIKCEIPFERNRYSAILPNLMEVAAGSWMGVLTSLALPPSAVVAGSAAAATSYVCNLLHYQKSARMFATRDLIRHVDDSAAVVFSRVFSDGSAPQSPPAL